MISNSDRGRIIGVCLPLTSKLRISQVQISHAFLTARIVLYYYAAAARYIRKHIERSPCSRAVERGFRTQSIVLAPEAAAARRVQEDWFYCRTIPSHTYKLRLEVFSRFRVITSTVLVVVGVVVRC